MKTTLFFTLWQGGAAWYCFANLLDLHQRAFTILVSPKEPVQLSRCWWFKIIQKKSFYWVIETIPLTPQIVILPGFDETHEFAESCVKNFLGHCIAAQFREPRGWASLYQSEQNIRFGRYVSADTTFMTSGSNKKSTNPDSPDHLLTFPNHRDFILYLPVKNSRFSWVAPLKTPQMLKCQLIIDNDQGGWNMTQTCRIIIPPFLRWSFSFLVYTGLSDNSPPSVF